MASDPCPTKARRVGDALAPMIDGATNDAVGMLDAQGFVTIGNRGTKRIKGWRAREIVDRPARLFCLSEATPGGPASAGDIAVTFGLAPGGVAFVKRIHMQQVFVDLLRNATEAAASARVRLPRVATGQRGTMARASVRDTGRRIPTPMLFAPRESDKPDGTDAGLSTCRTIVEAHHRRIGLSIRTGITQVGVTLPIMDTPHAGA